MTRKLLSDLYAQGDRCEILFAHVLAIAKYGDEKTPLEKSQEKVFRDAVELVGVLVRTEDFLLFRRSSVSPGKFFISALDEKFLNSISEEYQAGKSEENYKYGVFLQKQKTNAELPEIDARWLTKLALEYFTRNKVARFLQRFEAPGR